MAWLGTKKSLYPLGSLSFFFGVASCFCNKNRKSRATCQGAPNELRESCSWISRRFVVIRRLFNEVMSLRLTLARWSRAAVLQILVYFDCLRFFFWRIYPSVRSSAYSFAVLCSTLWLMCLYNPSITLNLKYLEKPNHDLRPKHCVGFSLEIGQWGSNGPPSVILGGSFSR